MKTRCNWCGRDPLYISYHDNEWGVALHDDRRLFEMLVLEGMQAGLSWLTILKKRDNFRRAFDNFDIKKVALYTRDDIESLLSDPAIVRNRRKLESAVKNAAGVLRIMEEFGSFDAFVWRYVDYAPVHNAWRSTAEIPAESRQSKQMSRDLKKRGFGFTGPVICYSFMQAVGMVNDHVIDCFRYEQIKQTEVL